MRSDACERERVLEESVPTASLVAYGAPDAARVCGGDAQIAALPFWEWVHACSQNTEGVPSPCFQGVAQTEEEKRLLQPPQPQGRDAGLRIGLDPQIVS